jgi:hypothetical protein
MDVRFPFPTLAATLAAYEQRFAFTFFQIPIDTVKGKVVPVLN